jgi:hypothetical protein
MLRYYTKHASKHIEMLQKEGFTAEQAAGLANLLKIVLDESIKEQTNTVSKQELETIVTNNLNDINRLEMDIRGIESLDYANSKQQLEKANESLNSIKSKIRDDITKIQGGVKLDLNLAQSRFSDENKKVLEMLQKSEAKIDQEIAKMRDRIESISRNTKKTIQSMFLLFRLRVGDFGRLFGIEIHANTI